jgi:hypothetical protein
MRTLLKVWWPLPIMFNLYCERLNILKFGLNEWPGNYVNEIRLSFASVIWLNKLGGGGVEWHGSYTLDRATGPGWPGVLKKSPNLLKSSPKVPKYQHESNFYHLHQTTFELITKLTTNHDLKLFVWEKPKVALFLWALSSLQKITMGFPKWPNWWKIAQSGHTG